MEGPKDLSLCDRSIRNACTPSSFFGVHPDDGVDCWIVLLDPGEEVLEHVNGAHSALAAQPGNLDSGLEVEAIHDGLAVRSIFVGGSVMHTNPGV
jgi:hypothetical protein